VLANLLTVVFIGGLVAAFAFIVVLLLRTRTLTRTTSAIWFRVHPRVAGRMLAASSCSRPS